MEKYFSVFTKLAMSLESSVFFDEWKTFFWRSDKVKQSHSPEVARYLYKSTIFPCMEYCCHVWAGTPSCYLELLDKLQKWIYRTVLPSLAASLEPLTHCWNMASLCLFYWCYFGRCSLELAQLVLLPFSWERSTRYSDRLHDFSVTIPRCYKDVYMLTVSFLTQLGSGILCL